LGCRTCPRHLRRLYLGSERNGFGYNCLRHAQFAPEAPDVFFVTAGWNGASTGWAESDVLSLVTDPDWTNRAV